ncbi:MAG TPA: type VI secretion system baseplate subunit TssE [Candidatus Koribacter sp.]|jgi:type VI secretion system protein ImpF
MAQGPELIVTQSILDRLIDDEPGVRLDSPATRASSFRQFKTGVRRDLEWLLNTRQIPDPAPREYKELFHSLYNYGLPDITSISKQSVSEQRRLLQALEQALMAYEPRILNVNVSLDSSSQNLRVLRFRIEGMLRVDPSPEHVSFDTVLDVPTGEYEVKS